MKFSDTKRWGQLTFLDYCEANKIRFSFDGKNLNFPDSMEEGRATCIWYHLTGCSTIGVYP